jgi:hypothetical protein
MGSNMEEAVERHMELQEHLDRLKFIAAAERGTSGSVPAWYRCPTPPPSC